MDCANGATYKTAPDIFSELGAEIIVINNEPDGLNINKNCGALHPEVVREHVLKEKADIGISLDGDGDRVIIVDDGGNIIDGDSILCICALEWLNKGKLKKNTLVVTHYSNLAVDETIRKLGGNVVRVDNGDKYVIDEMMKNGYNLGGEQSGHIIFSDYTTTGDGIIAALQILNILKKSNKKMSELAKYLKTYPQVLINVNVKEKKNLDKMKNVREKIKEIESKLKDKGRILVRYSGTENIARVMIEGKDENDIKKYADMVANEIQKEVGA